MKEPVQPSKIAAARGGSEDRTQDVVGGMKIQRTHKRFGSTNHYDYSNHKIYPQT